MKSTFFSQFQFRGNFSSQLANSSLPAEPMQSIVLSKVALSANSGFSSSLVESGKDTPTGCSCSSLEAMHHATMHGMKAERLKLCRQIVEENTEKMRQLIPSTTACAWETVWNTILYMMLLPILSSSTILATDVMQNVFTLCSLLKCSLACTLSSVLCVVEQSDCCEFHSAAWRDVLQSVISQTHNNSNGSDGGKEQLDLHPVENVIVLAALYSDSPCPELFQQIVTSFALTEKTEYHPSAGALVSNWGEGLKAYCHHCFCKTIKSTILQNIREGQIETAKDISQHTIVSSSLPEVKIFVEAHCLKAAGKVGKAIDCLSSNTGRRSQSSVILDADALLFTLQCEQDLIKLLQPACLDEALQVVFQSLARCVHAEQKFRAKKKCSHCLDPFTLHKIDLIGLCWQFYMKAGDRVTSASYFQKHVGLLAKRGAFELCEVYYTRGLLLAQLEPDLCAAVWGPLPPLPNPDESMSMFLAATDLATRLSNTDPAAALQIQVRGKCAVSTVLLQQAVRESNKETRVSLLHRALTGVQLEKGTSNDLDQCICTVLRSVILFHFQQHRKAAFYVNDLVNELLAFKKEGADVQNNQRRVVLLAAGCIQSLCQAQYNFKTAIETVASIREVCPLFPTEGAHKLPVLRAQAALGSAAGLAHYHLKEYEMSLEEYSKALALYVQLNDQWKESQCFGALSQVYESLDRVSQAINFRQQQYDMAHDSGESLVMHEALRGKARLLALLRQFDEAMKVWQEILNDKRWRGDPEVEIEASKSVIAAHEQNNNYSEVLKAASYLAKVAQQSKNDQEQCNALEKTALAQLKLGHYDRCIEVLNELETKSEESSCSDKEKAQRTCTIGELRVAALSSM